MDPACKVPILRLGSLYESPNEPPSPSELIESYLGVQLNSNYCYLSSCINDTICYIWSRRPTESENTSLQNNLQEMIFEKVIQLLMDKKPLILLQEIAKEKSKMDIRYNPPIGHGEVNDVECRAGLIATVFSLRISSRYDKQSPYERYHRDILATALTWHMKEFFMGEAQVQIKSSTSCPTIIEEFNDPTIKLSPGGRMIKRTSQSNIHRSMPWVLNQPKVELFNNKEWDLLEPYELIKAVSMECLYYCRTYWQGNEPHFENDKPRLEYQKLQECKKFLIKPQMGLLVEEEVARDITFEFSGEKLAYDIGRNILHLSVINSSTSSSLPKIDTENLSKESRNDIKKFNHSCRFQNLLTNLMLGLKIKHNKTEEILEKWNWQVNEEKSNLSNDSFTEAVKKFFNEDLDHSDNDKNNLRQLLILMRQRMYIHPMSVIREALIEIPLQYENDNPSRVMSYQFLEGSAFEYRVSQIGSVTKEVLKSSKKIKSLPPFQFEMLNVMSSSLNDLSTWSSAITITISVLPGKKKGSAGNELFEKKVVDPLQKLGFKVIII